MHCMLFILCPNFFFIFSTCLGHITIVYDTLNTLKVYRTLYLAGLWHLTIFTEEFVNCTSESWHFRWLFFIHTPCFYYFVGWAKLISFIVKAAHVESSFISFYKIRFTIQSYLFSCGPITSVVIHCVRWPPSTLTPWYFLWYICGHRMIFLLL